MEKRDALQILTEHAGITDGPRMDDGILGMLRPYQGVIERNFHEVVDCIYRLHDELGADAIKNDIIRSTLSILITMRNWAMSPTGMLRSNRLIDNDSLLRLGNWYEVIETATIRYMSGGSHGRALYKYMEYLAGYETVATVANDAAVSAIHDAFSLGEDYQIVALAVGAKYPQLGRSLLIRVTQQLQSTPDGDLKNAMANYLHKLSDLDPLLDN